MPRHTDSRDTTNRRETDSQRTDEQRPAGQSTMAEVSHTNPTTGETFGDSQVFERGKVAVVDGGHADTEPEDEDREDEPMGDVDHTPRHDAPDASEVYDRGVERVDDEEENGDEAEAPHDAKSEPEADV